MSQEGPWIAFVASVDCVPTITVIQPKGRHSKSVSRTYNDNTVIVDAGEDVVVILRWRGVLRALLRVDSDVETFTGMGWRVYGHPGMDMESGDTTVERELLDSRNHSPQ